MFLVFVIVLTVVSLCQGDALDATRLEKLCRKGLGAGAACFSLTFCGTNRATAAMLTFPLPVPLRNNVVLLRAGESFADEQGIIETSPVKKLSLSNALTNEGKSQIVRAALKMCSTTEENFGPSWIWTSNTERAYETATILARECGLGQNRIVPEFSFLDARAMGAFEGQGAKDSYAAVHAGDESAGVKFRPPSLKGQGGGVPSDSIEDVLVRANQLMSTLEGLYSGENVVVVSPDSEVLSVVQAALAEEDVDKSLPRHARFGFKNGEYRYLSDKTFVKPPDRNPTGQTPEEADTNNRRFKAIRMAPARTDKYKDKGGDRGGDRDSDKAADLWFDLYNRAVDARLDDTR